MPYLILFCMPMLPTKTSPVWMPQRIEILSEIETAAIPKRLRQTSTLQPLIDTRHGGEHLDLRRSRMSSDFIFFQFLSPETS